MGQQAKKIEDIIPIFDVDDGGLISTKNADLCIAFEIQYPEIFALPQSTYQTAFQSLFLAIRNIGEGYLVHKQDLFFEQVYQPDFSYNQENDFVIRQNELHFKDRPYVAHKGYIYVILPSSDPINRKSPFSSLYKGKLLGKEISNPKTVVSFLEKVKAFQHTINQSKVLTLHKLDKKAITGDKEKVGLLNYYFSMSFKDASLYDISSKDGDFKVADKYSKTFVINDLEQFPNELPNLVPFRDYNTDSTQVPVSLGLSFGLNIPFNHIYNQVIYIPKQQELSTKKINETKRHYSFSSWSRDNTYSMEQKTRFVDTLKTGAIAVKAHFNIQVFHEEKKQLEEYKDILAATIQNVGFISKVATTYAEQLYWSCIPSNASEIGSDNFSTLLLDNALSMWNMESHYEKNSFQNSGILLTDRFGNPRIVDLFFQPLKDGRISNRNFTIVGPSGSGKSFSVNNIIYYLLASKAHITIVDIGHSYKRIGQILGAKYIEHTDENPVSINPFYCEGDMTEEFKQVIAKIIFLLYKKEGETILKSEEVTVFDMVDTFYAHIATQKIRPCFDSFYEFVKTDFRNIFKQAGGREEKEFDLEKFTYVIRPFYKGGQYDFLLNGKDDTDLAKHPFVIYELDNIKDHPILLPIITLMITNTYVSKLFSTKGILKVLIIEEAWRAVSNDFFATFLLWAFKTARKHLGSIGVVTQEIEDLLKSAIIKDAIVQNTDIKLVLDLRKYVQQADEVLKLFKINVSNIPQIFSINKPLPYERGNYKELAVVLGDHCKVYGTEVSKYALSLFTTEQTQVVQIENIAKTKNISLKEAAFEWADNQSN